MSASIGVVVIDDTPDFRALLRNALERNGRFHILGEAGDGAAGVNMVREIRPDLVLLDLAMPLMDGLEALSLIRSQHAQSRVIILSGFASENMAEQVYAAGADGYVQKGASATQMVADIANIMGVAVQPRVDRPEQQSVDELRESRDLEGIRGLVESAVQELGGPTAVLHAMAELLINERSTLSERSMDRMLDTIVRQARVLDRVTDDLLAATHAKSGSLVVRVQPLCLADSLYAAAFAVSPRQDVTVICPSGLWVSADPTRIQHAVGNLLANAFRYGAPPVHIAVEKEGTFAVIRVIDRGPRVPTQLRSELFRHFSSSSGATGRGFGVGLYVVRTLVEASGGRAWYAALDDGGSAFCISLPVCPPDELAGNGVRGATGEALTSRR